MSELPEPPPIWTVPLAWQTLAFASDIHLTAESPRTFEAWAHFMRTVQADALFLLGDLFEVWLGDDCLDDPAQLAFEVGCVNVIAATARRMPVVVMHGNRDFLLGHGFEQRSGARLLADPTVVVFGEQTIALSHGDAWCTGDHAYQGFRQTVRSPAWQAAFLARPLTERLAMARGIRDESQRRQADLSPDQWADVDPVAAQAALHRTGAAHVIHGHTHRPGASALGPHLRRWVLSDWDMDHAQPRASFLRWQRGEATPLSVSATP